MAIRTIPQKTGLLSVLRYVGYTLGRLRADPQVSHLAGPFEEVWELGLSLVGTELSLALEEFIQQGRVEWTDRKLDWFVIKFEKQLFIEANGDKGSPLYNLFMQGQTAAEIRRPVLGPELETVRGWLELLSKMDNLNLTSQAPDLQQLVTEADQSISSRANAWHATSEFRNVGERKQYIDKVNAQSKATYGLLAEMVHTPGNEALPKDYADLFFLHESRESEPEPTLEEVKERVETLAKELKEEQDLLAELEKEEAEMEEDRKAQLALAEELREAEKARSDANKRVAALQAKIRKK